MRVGIVGVNHKLADLRLRELLAEACKKKLSSNFWMDGDYSSVLLSTCNRTEVYFCSEDLAQTHSWLLNILRREVPIDFEQKLYSYFGLDCFLHLTRVTAGLDSALIGETEIQGQVNQVYEQTCQCHTLPKDLHFLFQKSRKIAKQVRNRLKVGKGLPTLNHSTWHVGEHFFNDMEIPRILFIGASQINHSLCAFFKEKGLSNITICNRSEDRAQAFAGAYQLHSLAWSRLKEWVHYDWIIVGTKCPHYLLSHDQLPTFNLCPFGAEDFFQKLSDRPTRKLIIDLSVPRNVEPKLSKDPFITLLNIDQIQRLVKCRTRKIQKTITLAEEMIAIEAKKQLAIWAKKMQHPMLCIV